MNQQLTSVVDIPFSHDDNDSYKRAVKRYHEKRLRYFMKAFDINEYLSIIRSIFHGLLPIEISHIIQRIIFFDEKMLRFMNGEIELISCGFRHSMIQTPYGLYACGSNNKDQLGIQRSYLSSFKGFVEIDDDKTVLMVACGHYHTMILMTDKSLYACGGNECGQLGIITDKESLELTRIRYFDDLVYNNNNDYGYSISSVVCGSIHTMVITENGSLYGCGSNNYNQLGILYHTVSNIFTRIMCLDDETVISVACGTAHTMILTKRGALFSVGCNLTGQLGLNHRRNPIKPEEVKISLFSSSYIVSMSCGRNFSMVLDGDGSIFGCGDNECGWFNVPNNQGVRHCIYIFTKINYIEKVIAFKCGTVSVTALTENNKVYEWGIIDRYICEAQEITNLENDQIISISHGGEHKFITIMNETIYAYGDNNHHQQEFEEDYQHIYDNKKKTTNSQKNRAILYDSYINNDDNGYYISRLLIMFIFLNILYKILV